MNKPIKTNGCLPPGWTLNVGTQQAIMPRQTHAAVIQRNGLRHLPYPDDDYTTTPPHLVFGPKHEIGDIVEVGNEIHPDRPPCRRAFLAYAFDAEFKPVVLTYHELDTASFLEDRAVANLDLNVLQTWEYIFPTDKEAVNISDYLLEAIKTIGEALRSKLDSLDRTADLRVSRECYQEVEQWLRNCPL